MEVGTLKSLLGITGEEKDELLRFALADAEEIILNYCNLSSLPNGLRNTAYRMAADIYRQDNFGSDAAPASQIREGDLSVSFGTDAKYAESLLKNYATQLNRYRKLVWR